MTDLILEEMRMANTWIRGQGLLCCTLVSAKSRSIRDVVLVLEAVNPEREL